MSKVGVSIKINTSMVDMTKCFPGQKGQYLDATVFIDLDQLDQYGNSGMITQDVTKEEKAQGVQGNILGNARVFWADGLPMPVDPSAQPQRQPQQQGGGFGQSSGIVPQNQAPQGFNQQPQRPPQNQGGFGQQPQRPPAQQQPQQYDNYPEPPAGTFGE